MSGKNPDTSTFIKDHESQDSESYSSSSSSVKHVAVPAIKSPEINVEHLNSVDSKLIEHLLSLKDVREKEMLSSAAGEAVPKGIYKSNGKTFWVLPEGFYHEDNAITAMVIDFSKLMGIELKQLDSKPIKFTNVYDDKFALGLWFGMFSSTNQKRRRAKQSYELGRTCTFSLIVKNVFEASAELGPRALQKDNFFFGNYEGELSKKERTPFYVKMKLRSFFEDPSMGDLIYGILNQTASFVGFNHLTEDEERKVIMDHLVPLDALITSCYPSTTRKRGKAEEKIIRKPNPIRTSPLYKREEMDLIQRLSAPIFADLDQISSDYESALFSRGFNDLERGIRDSIRLRWETLQRFANRTKLRLQAIRKIVNNPTLRKANVVPNQIDLLLDSYQTPASNLASDIEHILGGVGLKSLLSFVTKKDYRNVSDVRIDLLHKTFQVYENIGLKDLKKKEPVLPNISQEPSDIDTEKAFRAYIRVRNITGEIKRNSLGLARIPSFKLFGRFKQLAGLFISLPKELSSLEKINERSIDIIISIISEGHYKSAAEFKGKFYDELQKAESYIFNICSLRLKEETDKVVISALNGFLKTLEANGINSVVSSK